MLTSSQALEYLLESRRFIEGQNNVTDDIFQAADKLESLITAEQLKSKKQTKITSFFHRK